MVANIAPTNYHKRMDLLGLFVSGGAHYYDPLFDVSLNTGAGRVKYGNKRGWAVWVRPYGPHGGLERIAGFKANDEAEAMQKFNSDKRVEAYYEQQWKREFNTLIGIG